ncbi:MAG: DNA-deoxyinosine glycosylase [Planctomycetaceae bacterium]|nr:DNA-deoxyinosine glycosylase [Planctomycetaceae bacterium]
MPRLTSFPPIASPDARVLVLGSMPGEESLRRQQYYAHPQNAFWPIMGELFSAGADLPYPERTGRLREAGVAVWDVLKHCRRAGSLDASIESKTIVANDFLAFFAEHSRIRVVFFNGRKAEEMFRRRVLPELGAAAAELSRHLLPSTSPAYASLSRGEKLDRWRVVREVFQVQP